jgi:uncharacterized protein YecE (DUF72 family)
MSRIHVGLSKLQGDVAKLQTSFDMVELRPADMGAPKTATLRGWRRATHPAFAFSVVMPRAVLGSEKTGEAEKAFDGALSVATTVEARCIVVETPSDFRPTARSREKLLGLFERLPKPGVILCWEPRGLWDAAEVVAFARELGAVAVFDGTREPLPSGNIAYTRIRSLGVGARGPSLNAIDRLARSLSSRREAFVVAEDRASATRLRAELGKAIDRLRAPQAPMIVKPSPGRLRAEDEEQ